MIKKEVVITGFILWVIAGTIVQTAHAQEKSRFYIGFNTLYAIESLDDQKTRDKFIGNVSVDFDNTFGLQGRVGYIANEYFSAEGMIEYFVPTNSELGYGYESDIDAINFSLNAKGTLPLKEYLVPYALFGLGIMNSYEDISGPHSKTKSDWGISSRIGLGVDLPIRPNLSLGGEMAYVFGFGNVDHIRFVNVTIGIAYRFRDLPF